MANASAAPADEPLANTRTAPQSSTSGTSTGSAPSTAQAPAVSAIERLKELVNVSHVRFAWFVSNVIVVANGLSYIQPLFGGVALHTFWYRMTFLGAFSTFAIVIFQNLKSYKTATGGFKISTILQDDNVHYMYDAFIWLIFPKHFLAMIPFVLFSLFHVLSFTGKELLPALNFLPGIATKITSFTVQYHEFSRTAAATSELLLLVVLIFKALFFYKWSWICLAAYSLFIKVKSEGSIFTRNVLKSWEVRMDGLVSNQSVPPAAKSYWGSFKRLIKTADKYSLIKKIDSDTQKVK